MLSLPQVRDTPPHSCTVSGEAEEVRSPDTHDAPAAPSSAPDPPARYMIYDSATESSLLVQAFNFLSISVVRIGQLKHEAQRCQLLRKGQLFLSQCPQRAFQVAYAEEVRSYGWKFGSRSW